MDWIKLTEKSLNKLKKTDLYILMECKDRTFPFEIIEFVPFTSDNPYKGKEENKPHWVGYSNISKKNYEFCDKELLDTFKCYQILTPTPF